MTEDSRIVAAAGRGTVFKEFIGKLRHFEQATFVLSAVCCDAPITPEC